MDLQAIAKKRQADTPERPQGKAKASGLPTVPEEYMDPDDIMPESMPEVPQPPSPRVPRPPEAPSHPPLQYAVAEHLLINDDFRIHSNLHASVYHSFFFFDNV